MLQMSLRKPLFLLSLLFYLASSKTWYVNVSDPRSSDAGQGEKDKPFKSISPAAVLAQPGDTVLVGRGVYRERVAPARGGEEGKPIIYRAGDGEKVVIKASETLKWSRQADGTYRASLPSSLFDRLDGTTNSTLYNPFNDTIQKGVGCRASTTGEVWIGDTRLAELPRDDNITHILGCQAPYHFGTTTTTNNNTHNTHLGLWHTPHGCFSSYKNGTELVAQWPDWYNKSTKSRPSDEEVEVTVRSRVFAPHIRGLQYITVQGFIMEHAGNQWDANFWYPQNFHYAQSGILGTRSGYRWTIRNNTLRKAKTIGLDFGTEGGYRPAGGGDNEEINQTIPNVTGQHIIEQNIIEMNGASGVQGYGGTGQFLNNLIQHNGEIKCAGAENAAYKSHGFTGLFEGNVFRNNTNGVPVWFDGGVTGRVTRNTFLVPDQYSSDGLVLEIGDGPALVDNNLIIGSNISSWHQHWTPHGKTRPGGSGVGVQDMGGVTFAHNLVLDFTGGPAISLHGLTGRKSGNHTADMRNWWISANLLLSTMWCPFVYIHPQKNVSTFQLIFNETAEHNIVTGDVALIPSQTSMLHIKVDHNFNATVTSASSSPGLNFTLDREGMTLTVLPDNSVTQSGCIPLGPGSDHDFTGAKRNPSKCVPGPIDGLVPGRPRTISLWPNSHQ